MNRKIRFFAEGTHKTSAAKKNWTASDVEAIARTVAANPDGEIELRAGHLEGVRVGSVKAKDISIDRAPSGKTYLAFSNAEFAKTAPALLKKSGFNKLSAGIKLPDMTLDHIAFVEEAAVEEMNDMAVFGAAETIEQSDALALFGDADRFRTTASVFKRMREWMISKFSVSDADLALPAQDIDYLNAAVEEELLMSARQARQELREQPINESSTIYMQQTSVEKELQVENARLLEQVKALTSALDERAKTLAKFEREKLASDLGRALDDSSLKGIVTTKNRAMHQKALEALAAGEQAVAEFAAGESKYSLPQAAAEYLAELAKQPKVYEQKEIAKFGGSESKTLSPEECGKRAAQLVEDEAKQGRTMSVVEAYKIVDNG